MTKELRLQMILAYEFSGQLSYESCDIVTRERIDKLIKKLLNLFGYPCWNTKEKEMSWGIWFRPYRGRWSRWGENFPTREMAVEKGKSLLEGGAEVVEVFQEEGITI